MEINIWYNANIMSKRRTRKNKERAHHKFTLSWSSEASNLISKANVNRQIKTESQASEIKISVPEKAMFQAKEAGIEATKKDLIKSLILVSLILGIEVVIYSFWH